MLLALVKAISTELVYLLFLIRFRLKTWVIVGLVFFFYFLLKPFMFLSPIRSSLYNSMYWPIFGTKSYYEISLLKQNKNPKVFLVCEKQPESISGSYQAFLRQSLWRFNTPSSPIDLPWERLQSSKQIPHLSISIHCSCWERLQSSNLNPSTISLSLFLIFISFYFSFHIIYSAYENPIK